MPARRGAPSGRVVAVSLVVAGLLILVAVGSLALRNWMRGPYEQAARLWTAEADVSGTLALLDQAGQRKGLEGPEAELRGLVLLSQGRETEGAEALAEARARSVPDRHRRVALVEQGERLLERGLESALLPLVEHARAVLSPLPATVLALEGFAHHARADLEAARASYRAALDAALEPPWRGIVETQLGRAAEEARSGRVPIVFARGGEVLAWRDARTRQLVAAPELAALLGGAQVSELPGIEEADLDGRVELSLDAGLQRRLMSLFRRETGAFVALSVPDGEILAAASEAEPALPLLPLAPVFQPGSTLKVLTMAAWLDAGRSDDLVLPHDCRGNDFVLGGEILYDWAAHGRVADLERALSLSCNTVFAKMGLELGEQRLRDALRPLGFGASLDEGAGPSEGEGVELAGGGRALTGALAAGPLDPFRLARTAMGLDESRMSALQAALVASTFADQGRRPAPRLVRRRMNLLGRELQQDAAPAPVRVFSPAAAERVARAMEAVVTDADGTGRGARSAGLPVALKTGTTGGDGAPLSSAFVGFLPSRSPEVAFGLFTRDSGRSLDVSRRVLGPLLRESFGAGRLDAAQGR